MAETSTGQEQPVTEEKPVEKKPTKEKSQTRANIPKAVFVEDVDKFMQAPENTSAEQVLRRLDEEHTKYKFMESNLIEKKRRLRNRIPDLKKTLDMIKFLKSIQGSDKSFTTHYPLADGVYTTAEVSPTDTVLLWLGANVMLEYPIEDAFVLLNDNLITAEKSLADVDEDLEFITDQCTTVEVAMTRVYNWDVKERREKKQALLK